MSFETNPDSYIAGLRDEIAEAKRTGDKIRAAAAQSELDTVTNATSKPDVA